MATNVKPFQPGDGYRAMALLLWRFAKWTWGKIQQAWWATPFHFWGHPGVIFGGSTVFPWAEFFFEDKDNPMPPGMIRAPFGGMIEAVIRRRRRCCMCGKFFWRQGWWNPLAGVNIFEEHCSKACSDDDLESIPM